MELQSLISKSARPYILVNFFATWCKPCRTELPDLVELQNDAASEIEVLLVSIDKREDVESKLQDFLGEFGVNFKTYARPEGEEALIRTFYPLWDNHIPLSLVFNKQGYLLEAITGLTDRAEIELIVNRHKQLGS
ncbi:MAG: TlpA disulfide reductase family protein [Bacteroidia bacterium]